MCTIDNYCMKPFSFMLNIHYPLQLIAIFLLQSYNLMYIHFFYITQSVKFFFFSFVLSFYSFSLLVYMYSLCVFYLYVFFNHFFSFAFAFHFFIYIGMYIYVYILGSIHPMLYLSSIASLYLFASLYHIVT